MRTARNAFAALLALAAVAAMVTFQSCGGGSAVSNPVHTHEVASISVEPSVLALGAGNSFQLVATPRCECGEQLSVPVRWGSSDPSVATVDASGLVRALAEGTAEILAAADGPTGAVLDTATVEVGAPIDRVVIWGMSSEPIATGTTLQLTATAYDDAGQPLEHRMFQWASSDEAVATVDSTGLVKGVATGKVTITATSEGVSGIAEVQVTGETSSGDVEGGNNMSWPVVFAEGIGLTGQAVATDPGVRPTPAEGVTVDSLPFWWEGNVPSLGDYYEQGTASTWRAELIDGTGQPPFDVSAYWGDNLTAKEWKVGNPIRVEIALSATGVGTLTGFNMTYLYGSGTAEMQGTDGSTGEYVPLLYTKGPSFIVERLDGEGGSVVSTPVDAIIASEVNVSGRAVYGYQFTASSEGWYRLRFSIAEDGNARLTAVGNSTGMFLPVVVSPRETVLEIHVLAE